jgi:molybdopterin converting factor small subunit
MANDEIRIQVLFFASAREAAGDVSSTDLTLQAGADTAGLRYV